MNDTRKQHIHLHDLDGLGDEVLEGVLGEEGPLVPLREGEHPEEEAPVLVAGRHPTPRPSAEERGRQRW